MSVSTAPWENRLLDWAYEGIANPPGELCLGIPDESLEHAYATCDAITAQHSRTFLLASGLLPFAKRRAVRALYAFCRTSDDIVDRNPEGETAEPQAALRDWRQRALGYSTDEADGFLLAWIDTCATYSIPRIYAEQLIDGVAQDLICNRYATFEELTVYCYAVASTVGLMSMHIVGFTDPTAVPYAVKLGVALQLTNILRDVGEDWRSGRLYLPTEELAAFGLCEADVAAGQVDERWRAFMRYQIERVRRLYADALPGIALLHPDGRFAIAAAAELYRCILDDIEAHDYAVFHRRAHVGTFGKLRRLPAIWWRASVSGYRTRQDGARRNGARHVGA